MGMPSTQASNALIYMSLVAMLALGLFVSWKNSKRNEFLSSNRTQRGKFLFILTHRFLSLLTVYNRTPFGYEFRCIRFVAPPCLSRGLHYL